MEELVENNQYLSLHQLSLHIKDAIEGNFMQQVWVVAEIASLNVNSSSGHCYLELVEKNEKQILAKLRANIWSFKLQNILNKFFQVTGSTLQAGMKTLLLVEVQYHAIYGISLNVVGIDPAYSLGDMAKKKKELQDRLIQEGLLNKNKEIPFPLVPQRIALISSETAAGYEDFVNQLQNNAYGYYIKLHLFPSVMQGDKTSASIVSAIQKIESKAQNFDVIVIVRGGGSTVELSAFDDYDIAKAIANSSLPVLTGIGHDRDESIADMVAHLKLKTPTAVAEYLLAQFQSVDEMLIYAKMRIKELLEFRIQKENLLINEASNVITRNSLVFLKDRKTEVESLKRDVLEFSNRYLEKKKRLLTDQKKELVNDTNKLLREKKYEQKDRLNNLYNVLGNLMQKKNFQMKVLEQKVHLLDPAKVLARGYTMSMVNGKVVKTVAAVSENEELTTIFKDGTVISKIIKNEQKEK